MGHYLSRVKYCSIQSWPCGLSSDQLMVPTTRNLTAPPTPLAYSGHVSRTPKSTHNLPVNQISACHIKNFLKQKMARNLKFLFISFYEIKDPLKRFKHKIQNSNSTGLRAILLCTCKPNIGKIRCKLREPIHFEKSLTDRCWQTTDSSALDKLGWLCQKRSLKKLYLYK